MKNGIKRHIAFIKWLILFAFMPIFSACTPQKQISPRESFIQVYLQKYPKATLQDIYKGSFQDVFGPAHLLTSREAVENYISQEMENASTLKGDAYTPCGWKGNFYQVNLSVIREGKVPLNEFVDAFMASANGIDTTLTPHWINEWELLQQAVRKVAPALEGFEEDSILLSHLLKEGKYVVHHSRIFNANYQPHYRIIRKDIFEEKILPKLKD